MKKGFYVVFIACLCMLMSTTGCSDKKPAAADSTVMDKEADTAVLDTLDALISEQPIPKAADELFDDFFFTFAGNRKHQLERIKFPLAVVSRGKTTAITKEQWKMESFFMSQGYYTLIFDNHKQLQLSKDTSINHVVVEKIYLAKKKVKKYNFDRLNGEWMLTSIENNAMYLNSNASFLAFYQQFATDTAFQIRSLNETVDYKGTNPENDQEELEGEITPDQWDEFSPGELPSGLIYNIIYGQKYTANNRKIFLLRGISNGQELEMTFKKMGAEWKLVKMVV
ncbi:MAG: DUF4348 domain-containing protein [Prevotellaceae bacterium]|nr:DUF4348 domain-containing protein [Prevotella sp.]MDD7258293.1 DUF4348 domain-containing protein [Prevotellaceae bacterium]MDY6130226.1 DUF4348 domain-containing protein [Prevotella sp.]